MHTTAKVRLTSVTIRIRIRMWTCDPDQHQKFNYLFIGPLPTFSENFMQIRHFLRNVANGETDDRQTDKQRLLHNLLGRGKYTTQCMQIEYHSTGLQPRHSYNFFIRHGYNTWCLFPAIQQIILHSKTKKNFLNQQTRFLWPSSHTGTFMENQSNNQTHV